MLDPRFFDIGESGNNDENQNNKKNTKNIIIYKSTCFTRLCKITIISLLSIIIITFTGAVIYQIYQHCCV